VKSQQIEPLTTREERAGVRTARGRTEYVGAAVPGRPGRATLGGISGLKVPVLFDGKKVTTRIYSREDLSPGKNYRGPAIITEYSATTVIPPGKKFHIDQASNLVISDRHCQIPL
jgi:N-methylhydantoinase A